MPASVDSKPLTQNINPLDATYEKHRGVALLWLTRTPTRIPALRSPPRRTRKDPGLRTAFGQLHQGEESVVYRGGYSEFRSPARNVAIQRVNLGALPAIQVLSRRGKRFRHLRGNLKRPRQSRLRIFQSGWTNSSSPSDGQHLIDSRLDYFPCIHARGDLPVLRAAQRGDSIQRAIPHQLCPELAFDIFRNA